MSSNQTSSSRILDTASYTFTIQNFKNIEKLFWIPELIFSHSRKFRFQFGIDPKTSSNSNNTCVTFWQTQRTEYKFEYEVSIIDLQNNSKMFTKNYEWNFDSNFDDNRNVTTLMSYQKLIDETNGFVIDNTLTLAFKVNIINSDSKLIKQSEANESIFSKLSNDFQTILESGDFSDFSLTVGDKEFKVHKNILAARSSVFNAMLRNDLEEKKQNRVEIIDVDVQVFEQLLCYIYSGTVAKLEDYALELFIAADKYQLSELKFLCGQSLVSSLTIETVTNILLHADMHTAPELKSKCIHFITSNAVQVMATDGWKQLLKTNRMQLMAELYADRCSN